MIESQNAPLDLTRWGVPSGFNNGNAFPNVGAKFLGVSSPFLGGGYKKLTKVLASLGGATVAAPNELQTLYANWQLIVHTDPIDYVNCIFPKSVISYVMNGFITFASPLHLAGPVDFPLLQCDRGYLSLLLFNPNYITQAGVNNPAVNAYGGVTLLGYDVDQNRTQAAPFTVK